MTYYSALKTGVVILKVVPFPSSLVKVKALPSWASMILFEILKPSHVPWRFVVKKGENICSVIPTANTTNEIITFVMNNVNSIGYGGVEFGDSTMHSSINNIKPSIENVINNSYPISRYLRYYTSDKPGGNIKRFIDWVMGPKGQQIVISAGYIPLWN